MIYRLPDYSAYLTAEQLEIEDRLWLTCDYYTTYATLVTEHLQDGRSVVEFGCGTGLVQQRLPADVLYVGLDANQLCVERARLRCRWAVRHSVAQADVRTAEVAHVDLTCAFAFLKHFALSEWRTVAANVMRPGARSVFTVPLVPDDYEDGTAYPHARVSERTVAEAAAIAGHRVLEYRWLAAVGETAVFTERG
jgi:SAM-dependent methyltransferase